MKEYGGTIVCRAPVSNTFQGAPCTRDEFYELSQDQLRHILPRLVGKPIRIEHGSNTPAGRVVKASMDAQGTARIRFVLEDNIPGNMAEDLIRERIMLGLSLSHRTDTLEPQEVSLCYQGARPYTGVTLVQASATNQTGHITTPNSRLHKYTLRNVVGPTHVVMATAQNTYAPQVPVGATAQQQQQSYAAPPPPQPTAPPTHQQPNRPYPAQAQQQFMRDAQGRFVSPPTTVTGNTHPASQPPPEQPNSKRSRTAPDESQPQDTGPQAMITQVLQNPAIDESTRLAAAKAHADVMEENQHLKAQLTEAAKRLEEQQTTHATAFRDVVLPFLKSMNPSMTDKNSADLQAEVANPNAQALMSRLMPVLVNASARSMDATAPPVPRNSQALTDQINRLRSLQQQQQQHHTVGQAPLGRLHSAYPPAPVHVAASSSSLGWRPAKVSVPHPDSHVLSPELQKLLDNANPSLAPPNQ